MMQAKKKAKKLKINQRIREKLVPLAVVVIVFLGTVLFGGRLVGLLKKELETRQDLRKKVAVLEGKIDFLEGINEPALERQVVELENVFPSRKPALNLLASLSKLAQSENVTVSSITLNPGAIEDEEEGDQIQRGKAVVSPPLQEFTLDFSVEGSLTQVGSFITSLEKTAPVMKIEEFSLSLGDQGVERKVKVAMTVRVFFQDLPASLGPVDQALPELSAEEVALLGILNSYTAYEPVLPLSPVGKENLFAPTLAR